MTFPFSEKIRPRFLWGLFFVALLGLHAGRLHTVLPVSRLFDKSAILNNQHTLDLAALLRDRGGVDEANASWGTDPTQSAGRLAGFPFERNARALIVFDRLVRPWASPGQSQKWFFFLLLLMTPFVIYSSARQFGFQRSVGIVGVVFSLILFCQYEPDSKDMIESGRHVLWASNYFAFLTLGFLWRACEAPFRFRRWLKVSVGVAWLLLLNPYVFLILLVPALAVLGEQMHGKRASIFLGLSLSSVLAGLANLPWIWPLLQRGANLASLSADRPNVFQFVQIFLPDMGASAPFENGLVLCFLLAFFATGVFKMPASFRRVFVLGAGALFYFAIGAPGLPSLGRFRLESCQQSFVLFLILPAAFGFARLFQAWDMTLRVIAGWLLWFGLSSPLAYSVAPPHLEVDELLKKSDIFDCIAKLKPSGRVLWESGLDTDFDAELLPLLTRHSVIGSVNPRLPWGPQRRTGFYQKTHRRRPGFLFGRPLTEFTKDELMNALQRYNVGYVVTVSLQARSRFDRHPDLFEVLPERQISLTSEERRTRSFHPYWPTDPVRVYRVKKFQSSWFIKGQGNVSFAMNEIRLSHLSAGPVVLKFHWDKKMALNNGIPMEPVFLGDDPTPFVAFINPTPGADIVVGSGNN